MTSQCRAGDFRIGFYESHVSARVSQEPQPQRGAILCITHDSLRFGILVQNRKQPSQVSGSNLRHIPKKKSNSYSCICSSSSNCSNNRRNWGWINPMLHRFKELTKHHHANDNEDETSTSSSSNNEKVSEKHSEHKLTPSHWWASQWLTLIARSTCLQWSFHMQMKSHCTIFPWQLPSVIACQKLPTHHGATLQQL